MKGARTGFTWELEQVLSLLGRDLMIYDLGIVLRSAAMGQLENNSHQLAPPPNKNPHQNKKKKKTRERKKKQKGGGGGGKMIALVFSSSYFWTWLALKQRSKRKRSARAGTPKSRSACAWATGARPTAPAKPTGPAPARLPRLPDGPPASGGMSASAADPPTNPPRSFGACSAREKAARAGSTPLDGPSCEATRAPSTREQAAEVVSALQCIRLPLRPPPRPARGQGSSCVDTEQIRGKRSEKKRKSRKLGKKVSKGEGGRSKT